MKADEPAFPFSVSMGADGGLVNCGLTKLELFTLAAMNGLLANDGWNMPNGNIAGQSILIAKATLTALSALAAKEQGHV